MKSKKIWKQKKVSFEVEKNFFPGFLKKSKKKKIEKLFGKGKKKMLSEARKKKKKNFAKKK